MISPQWYNHANKDARNVEAFGRMTNTQRRRIDMNSISGIYAIVNKVNGNQYIGSSCNVKYRWRQHLHLLHKGKHHSVHLQHAWNFYGENTFDFVVLVECSDSELIELEQSYIDALCPVYNICVTAGSRLGVGHTEETKEKLRQANLGKRYSEETKAKHSASRKGKPLPHTPEWNANLWINRIGWKHSEESKAKISASQKGKPLSKENKQGISNAMKGNTNTLGKHWKWKKKDD
jgi:group I intron endonuclease